MNYFYIFNPNTKIKKMMRTNSNLKRTVVNQQKIIEKCLYRIVELERYIKTIKPAAVIIPFNEIDFVIKLKIVIKKMFLNSPPILEMEKIEKITK